MSIRIIVEEPKELSGKNLFGSIIKERSNTLLVVLGEPVLIADFSSDLVQLTASDENENFNPLNQFYTVFAKGVLINPLTNTMSESIFTATVTLD